MFFQVLLWWGMLCQGKGSGLETTKAGVLGLPDLGETVVTEPELSTYFGRKSGLTPQDHGSPHLGLALMW